MNPKRRRTERRAQQRRQEPIQFEPMNNDGIAALVRTAWDAGDTWLLFLVNGPQSKAFALDLRTRYGAEPGADFTVLLDKRLPGFLVLAKKSYCDRNELAALIRKHAPGMPFVMPDNDEKDVLLSGTTAEQQAAVWWLQGQLHPKRYKAKAHAAQWN